MSNIDKEQQPEQQDNKQNELNLDFDEFEPITPKKSPQKPSSHLSFLDKLKALLAKRSLEQDTTTQSFETTDENEDSENEPTTQNKTHVITNLPTRYRRLAITSIALILIICLFIWLKPSSQPVDHLLSQENTLPVEFQPIDPNEISETNLAAQQSSPANGATTSTPAVADTAANNVAEVNALTQDSHKGAPQSSAHSSITTDTLANTAENSANAVETQPTLTQEQLNQIEQKAYEAEQARLIAQAKAKAEQRAREEFKAKQQESRRAQALLEGKNIPVVEAKPVAKTPKATASTPSTSSSGTTKYLTVPAGTSLMQVFRDNKLNIADVNAMTKANGAGNALSSFKPGDKVAVKVNNAGRVSELQLPNGAKFIRQDNGSYIYKK
ncbi:LysM-like peptidoglycan-binding domain-containing protein [Gallibacterium trehalosifermentans]|uniref:LysM-like peptidoglycan-binding domain-containing protein n=1 Tax=Gallibacterium trehalosifermentans TaxID=516935 RepID=A0ABV6H1C4_9PAST